MEKHVLNTRAAANSVVCESNTIVRKNIDLACETAEIMKKRFDLNLFSNIFRFADASNRENCLKTFDDLLAS